MSHKTDIMLFLYIYILYSKDINLVDMIEEVERKVVFSCVEYLTKREFYYWNEE